MASTNELNRLKLIADTIIKIDREKILRPDLGKVSLETELGPHLAHIQERVAFAVEYAPGVHDQYLSQVNACLEQIVNHMINLTNMPVETYVSQRSSVLSQIQVGLENLKQFWSPFITAAIEKRGFLQDEGIRKEYQKTIESIKSESSDALKKVQEEAAKTIQEARKLADEIETKARRTAAHISVKDAQEQFKLAQTDHRNQVIIWSILCIVAIAAFMGCAVYFLRIELPKEWQWQTIYYTALRITILTAFGAFATFSLRILRAHLHMYQHNLHRQRVANSMAAFVESAITPEQRDLILAHLVDAVAQFGCSGLLQKEDDSIYSPKMTIDSITRTFSPPQK